MVLLMGLGAGWGLVKPGGLDAAQTRSVLTSLVYYLLLPALILDVLWQADIGVKSLQYTVIGMGSIAICMFCMWLIGTVCRFQRQRFGAVLLAVFPNVTFLGLPVLEQLFGDWARSVVIQVDMFAASPFLYTIGIMVVRRYGDAGDAPQKPLLANLNAPPFWATAVAVLLNLNGVQAPDWLDVLIQKLSEPVAPLMVFSLGLALNWRAVRWRNMPYVAPVILIKMLLMPLVAFAITTYLGLENHYKAAAILDLAMPSMIMGVVFCDRYRLDSGLYAMTVTVTTLLSLVTLPFWYELLGVWLGL